MIVAPTRPLARRTLIGLEVVSGIGAVGGGIGLAAGNAIGMPADWLAATPFRSWFVPGLLLLLVVAVPMGTAAFAELRGWSRARALSLLAGTLQVAWIIAEWGIIEKFNWLQPTMLGIGAVIVVLALLPSRSNRG